MNEEMELKEPMDIDRLLEENGGELTPEIEAEYDRRHPGDWPRIVESRVMSIKRLEAKSDGLKGMADKFVKDAKSMKVAADQMRRSLVAELSVKGQQKILTETWTISRAKKPPRITLKEGTDLKNIEENLKRLIPEKWELDKMAVRESLKSRGLIPTEIGSWDVEDFDVEIAERLSIR